MLFTHGSLSLMLFAFWVLTLIDVVTTDDAAFGSAGRLGLGKVWWTVLVLLGLELGAVLWLVAGRPWTATVPPHRVPVPVRPRAESAEQFLLRCRQRAEEQRRRYRDDVD